jgi:hypothetical protein
LDERTFDLAWKIALLVCGVGCLLMFLASAGIITHRRRSGPKLTVEVEDEYDDEIIDVDDDFVSLIDEPSIPAVEDSKPVVEIDDDPLSTEILSDETEAEDDVDDGSGSSKRRQRRQARREEVEPTSVDLPPPPSPAEIIEELPPPPSPMELGTLPPPPGRDIVCECGASFKIKTIELKYVECPVCSERINL